MALAVKKRPGQTLPVPRAPEPGQAAAAAGGDGDAQTSGPPGAQQPAPRLIPPTAAAWQAAQELARPRAPPLVGSALTQPGMPAQFGTPPRSPASTPAGGSPAPGGSANPSPVTSEGRVTLLPGYASRPQPSPVKPPPRLGGREDGGFVRTATHLAGHEAHSAWRAGCQGVLGGGVGLGFGAQPTQGQGPPAGRFGAPALPWARDQVAAGSQAGPSRWQAPAHDQRSGFAGQPPAGPSENGAIEQAQAQEVDGASPSADQADLGGSAPRPRKRRRGGAEGEAAPGGGLLLLGGLGAILADQPTPQVSVAWEGCIDCCMVDLQAAHGTRAPPDGSFQLPALPPHACEFA